MSSIDETAYPRLREEVSPQELEQLYTPSPKERRFVAETYRRASPQIFLMLQLKLLQRLGYSVPLASIPLGIVAHICRKLKLSRPNREALIRYDESGEKTRHLRFVLQFLSLRAIEGDGDIWLRERALEAARTKQELPDIINFLLEELVKKSYVLPGFSILDRLACTLLAYIFPGKQRSPVLTALQQS